MYIELDQSCGDRDHFVDGVEGRVDGPGSDRSSDVLGAIGAVETYRCGRHPRTSAGHLQVVETEDLFGAGDLRGDQRLEVCIGDGLLAVGEILEMPECVVALLVVELIAHLLETGSERVAPAVLAENQLALGYAYGLGRHDLVGLLILEHAVLMNPGLVRESVGADNGLVGWYRHPGQTAHHPTGATDLIGMNVRSQAIERLPGVKSHDDLFQAGVARSLADPVDRDFGLSGSGTDTGNGVGGGDPEIVVTVNRPDHVFATWGLFDQLAEHVAVLLGHGIADCVRDVESGGT